MKYLFEKTKLCLILLVAALALTSCEDDDWVTREALEGSWRIVEVEDYSGGCPYRYDDQMLFHYDGTFDARGRGGFEQAGYWDVGRDVITIDFDRDGRSDVVAQILQLDHGYLVLDVTDYSYDCYYRLRLTRYY